MVDMSLAKVSIQNNNDYTEFRLVLLMLMLSFIMITQTFFWDYLR